MSTPYVTVIVLHWRGAERTLACLHSLAALDYTAYRVLLVDNGALPAEMQQIRAQFPTLDVLRLATNRGFAGGMNPAIRLALSRGSDYVLLLNNDTLVPPDLLTRLVAVQQQHPQVGILSPKLHRADEPGRLAGLGCTVTWYDVVPSGWDTPDTADTDHLLYFDAVFGSAMFVARAVFAQAGLLDERFFFYYEDIDLCLRARQHGFAVACDPTVRVQHAVAASTQHIRGLRMFYMGYSRQLFFQKYHPGITRLCFLLREPVHILRMARARWRVAGKPADAIGYLAGCLSGLVATLRPPAPEGTAR